SLYKMLLILKSFVLITAVFLSDLLLPSLAQEDGLNIRTGNKLYYIELSEQANFFKAAHACATLDMKLANLDTDSDVKRIKAILLLNDLTDNSYWLSGTTYGNSALTFIDFLTGSKIKFVPSNVTPAASQCLSTAASTFVYQNSDACAVAKYFICEKPLVPLCGKYGQCRYRYY
ncbi:hypothetical protein DOY81_005130, partial [Sarcophaga bullata]